MAKTPDDEAATRNQWSGFLFGKSQGEQMYELSIGRRADLNAGAWEMNQRVRAITQGGVAIAQNVEIDFASVENPQVQSGPTPEM